MVYSNANEITHIFVNVHLSSLANKDKIKDS